MRKLFAIFWCLLLAIGAQAQIADPVHFTSQLKDLKNGEAELIFKATIDAGWHVYSTGLGNDGVAGLQVLSIVDTTPIPHNGCRPPKKPRG